MHPCKTLVFRLVNVTTLTANVKSSRGRLPPCRPSATGRFVSNPIISTAGIVSPIVASTEPNKMFIECCSWFSRLAVIPPSPSGESTNAAMMAPPNACGIPNFSMLLSKGMANFSARQITTPRYERSISA